MLSGANMFYTVVDIKWYAVGIEDESSRVQELGTGLKVYENLICHKGGLLNLDAEVIKTKLFLLLLH